MNLPLDESNSIDDTLDDDHRHNHQRHNHHHHLRHNTTSSSSSSCSSILIFAVLGIILSLRAVSQSTKARLFNVTGTINGHNIHQDRRVLDLIIDQPTNIYQNTTTSNVVNTDIIDGLVLPNNDNTVLALIAMGTGRKYRLAERCIRSIRYGGSFNGYIMLFTDSEGHDMYQYSLSWDPKVLIIKGKDEDMNPTRNDGTKITMPKETMIYQRYKTLVPKYLSDYPQLDSTIQYILYLDIDNVVTQSLQGLFSDYHTKTQKDLHKHYKNNNTATPAYISFWRDVTRKKQYQGGQFLAHRTYGEPCLDAWKEEFDRGKSRKDQPLLMNVYKQYDKYNCSFFKLPSTSTDGSSLDITKKRRHFGVFSGDVYKVSPELYPTIVHITGLRTRLNSEWSQRNFLRKALKLEDETNPIMIGNITWDEVLTPVGPKGHKPKAETVETNQIESNETKPSIEVSYDLTPQTNKSFYNNIRPTDDNTAIFLIAMGRAGDSYIAERCIRSIRVSGEYQGFIILFTDEKGYEKKKEIFSSDPKVIVMKGKEEDMKPVDKDGTRIKYPPAGFMVFKRFKTLVLKYLNFDSRLNGVRYALYLDVDNIVANKMKYFFDDYAGTIETALAETNSSEFSYFSFFKDPGGQSRGRMMFQGGQIMYDRYQSTGCVDAWRNEMDTKWSTLDQPLLMNVYKNFTHYHCKIFELPHHKKHFNLLTTDIMKGKVESYPTFVHITSLRTKRYIRSNAQAKFIWNALKLTNETEMLTDDIRWKDVARPMDGRGRKPKKKKTKKIKTEKKEKGELQEQL